MDDMKRHGILLGRVGPRRRPGRHRDRRRRRAERGEPSGPRPGTRHRGGALPRSDERDPAGGGDAHDPSSPYGVSGGRRPLGGRPVPGDALRGRAPERLAPGFARDLASCLRNNLTNSEAPQRACHWRLARQCLIIFRESQRASRRRKLRAPISLRGCSMAALADKLPVASSLGRGKTDVTYLWDTTPA